MNWQPIDTAPKDGSPIAVTDGETYAAVRWRCARDATREQWAIDDLAIMDNYYPTIDFEPTEWMPLAKESRGC